MSAHRSSRQSSDRSHSRNQPYRNERTSDRPRLPPTNMISVTPANETQSRDMIPMNLNNAAQNALPPNPPNPPTPELLPVNNVNNPPPMPPMPQPSAQKQPMQLPAMLVEGNVADFAEHTEFVQGRVIWKSGKYLNFDDQQFKITIDATRLLRETNVNFNILELAMFRFLDQLQTAPTLEFMDDKLILGCTDLGHYHQTKMVVSEYLLRICFQYCLRRSIVIQ